MNEMSETFRVQHCLVTPCHPRGNRVAENHVKTACNFILKECQDRKEQWAAHINKAQLAMNTKVAALHNSSPYTLFFACQANGMSNSGRQKWYSNPRGALKAVLLHERTCRSSF